MVICSDSKRSLPTLSARRCASRLRGAARAASSSATRAWTSWTVCWQSSSAPVNSGWAEQKKRRQTPAPFFEASVESADLRKHCLGPGDFVLARRLDIELLHRAVLDQRRKALAAHAEPARHEIQFEPQRLGVG